MTKPSDTSFGYISVCTYVKCYNNYSYKTVLFFLSRIVQSSVRMEGVQLLTIAVLAWSCWIPPCANAQG